MIGAAIGAVIGLASTAMNFYSQYQSAKELKKLAAYRMKAAEQEARNVTDQSHQNVSRERENMQTYLSDVRANVAGMSGMVNADSMLQAQGEAASTLEMQIQDAARAEKMRSRNIMQAAAVGAWEDNQRAQATKISAFTDLISNTAKIAASIDWKGSSGGSNTTGRYAMKSLIDPVNDYSSKAVINATE